MNCKAPNSKHMFLFSQPIVPKASNRIEIPRKSRSAVTSKWICDFASSNEWVIPIADVYVNDAFNLQGLSGLFDHYSRLLKIIRGTSFSDEPELQQDAITLYGMIHARYLVTPDGVRSVWSKFQEQVFGQCPRVACNGQPMLPIGLEGETSETPAKGFCPRCRDVYDACGQISGSFYGPNFPHVFVGLFANEIGVTEPLSTTKSVVGVPLCEVSPGRCELLHGIY